VPAIICPRTYWCCKSQGSATYKHVYDLRSHACTVFDVAQTLHIDAYTLSMHCVQCHMNPEVCILIHTPCACTVLTVVQTLCSAILTHTPDACHRGDAWLQTGYNLLYGCWKYSWDADCELFLKILRGEVKEDVYVEQIQLQVLNSAAGCQIWPSLHTPVCLVTVSQQSIVPMVCYSRSIR